jgi:hypothetical protein
VADLTKAFTVEEANALLPMLERVLGEVRTLRDAIRERMDKLQVLDALWGEKVSLPANPDHGEFMEHRAAVARAASELETLVTREITARGLRFPAGGVEHGLIDFPTTMDGRWVFLCWRSSEPHVVAWHEVDGGFAGRQELTPEQAARMGRGSDAPPPDGQPLDL